MRFSTIGKNSQIPKSNIQNLFPTGSGVTNKLQLSKFNNPNRK